MARETKVGLLVGMCVILLIGIIISDHLSVVNQQQPAPLIGFARDAQRGVNPRPGDAAANAPADAASGVRATERSRAVPTPDEARPAGPRPPAEPSIPVPNNDAQLEQRWPQASEPTIAQGPGTPGSPGTPAASGAGTASATAGTPALLAHHTVKRGETLYSIAKQYYGKSTEWKRIQVANASLVGPQGQLKDAAKLAIPAMPGQTPSQPAAPTAPRVSDVGSADAPRTASTGTIRVQPSDTLASLAAKHLGSRDRWLDLLEANRDRLKRAQDLKIGMELRLPPSAGTSPRSGSASVTRVTSAPDAGSAPTPPAAGSAARSPASARIEAPATPSAPTSIFGRPSAERPESAATSLPAPRPSGPSTPAAVSGNRPGTPWPGAATPASSTSARAPAVAPAAPGARGGASAPAPVRTYTIQPGDSLQGIALQILGDANQWPRLYEANRAALAGQSQLRVGQELVIPPASSR